MNKNIWRSNQQFQRNIEFARINIGISVKIIRPPMIDTPYLNLLFKSGRSGGRATYVILCKLQLEYS